MPILVGAIATLFLAVFPAEAAKFCLQDLQIEVEKIANSAGLRSARVGVFVQTQSQILINLDGDKLFVPASNLKLFTTAAALQLLGSDYQIRTSLMVDALPINGAIANLWLIGRGDPSFKIDDLKALVAKLKASGVRQIRGRIMAQSQFQGSGLGEWLWQDLQEDYAAIAHGLILDENVLDWTITPTKVNQLVGFKWDRPELVDGWSVENRAVTRSLNSINSLKVERSLNQKQLIISGSLPANSEPELGAIAIPDPETHFLRLLQLEIIKQGIQITPSNQFQGSPNIELAAIASPKLGNLLINTNKNSNNLYAEALLRNLGAFAKPNHLTSNYTSTDMAGIATVQEFWRTQGITPTMIKDGSGLSPLNLVTPKAIATVLAFMSKNPIFRNSLAVAGVDGTLKNRFKTTQNQIQAKTGTLEGVAALSGYVQPPKYEELIFSLIINNANLPKSELQKTLDAIALLLIKLEQCD